MIDDIIELLTDDKESLVNPLLKTQVLSSRVENDELYQWVSSELKGYSGESVPDYRRVKCSNLAILQQGYHVFEEQPLPLMALGNEITSHFIKFSIDSGIKTLESIIAANPSGIMEKTFGADICAVLTKVLTDNGQRFRIISARTLVHNSEIVNILAEVRTKLLDLMLKLEKLYPNLSQQLKDKSIDKSEINHTITYIMKQVNITNTGDGNNINTGNNAHVVNNAAISKANKEELKEVLLKGGIAEEDYNELAEIIETDEPNMELQTFGPGVNNWIQNMIGKALNGGWNIAIGAAGSLLAEAIGKYYGF